MEEFGDWIYIIIIIIAGVASMISSTRKKARQSAEQNKPREIITNDRENVDIWDDFIPQAEKKPVENIKLKQQAKQVISPVKNYHTPFLDIFNEGQSSVQYTDIPSVSEEEYVSLTVDDLPDNTDEWRKALIYNEIFNRKN